MTKRGERREALVKHLRAKAPNGDPLDYICERLASGELMTKLEKELAAEIEQWPGQVRHGLRRALIAEYGEDEVLRRITAARLEAAHVFAERSLSVIQDADIERDALTKAKLESETLQWLAGKFNRPSYSDAKPDVAVTVVNVSPGQQHLDALRRRVVAVVEPTTEPPPLLESGD